MGSHTFDYNSGQGQKFTVPTGVEILDFVIRGGGASGNGAGRVTGKMRVNPKDVLWINVGQSGKPATGAGTRTGGVRTEGGGGEGGDGTGSGHGGDSGGGATIVRRDSWDGRIMAVAAGAGGDSGSGAAGGEGGAATGESGHGTAGGSNSTGGTQNQGGKGGTGTIGDGYWGKDGQDQKWGRAGAGGQRPNGTNTSGGGGGGGGYYPGGGGCAGRVGVAGASSGAGGSNFAGGLFNVVSTRGATTLGNGTCEITWNDPGDPPPTPPVDITIDGVPIADGLITRATTEVLLRGQPKDPDIDTDGLRLLVRMADNPALANFKTFKGTFDVPEQRDKVQLTGLTQNKRYYLRLFSQDNTGKISENYRSTNFFTNRKPLAPTPIEPAENVEFSTLDNVTFSWSVNDLDDKPGDDDNQTGFVIRYRPAATPAVPAGDWTTDHARINGTSSWVFDAGTFKGHTFYEWQVRSRDQAGAWGDFSISQSFYVTADAQPPILVYPVDNTGVPFDSVEPFRWRYRSPTEELQAKGDIRWRTAGSTLESDWTLVPGDTTTPGPDPTMPIDEDYLVFDAMFSGYRYEWQARTYPEGGVASDWSESGFFYMVDAPGTGAGMDLVGSGTYAGPLGQGNNRVYVYERGGKRMLGEITGSALIRWGRLRDDISGCTVLMTQWDEETKKFLGNLRTWMHEIVVFRTNNDGETVRVWEGPITRISGSRNRLEIESKDVMAYIYRRIMRQGYNDSYRLINGVQVGQKTVVRRAQQIIMNALAYDDPNVLAYLTPLNDDFDARTSRVVKDYTKTAWEEVDDLAAHAGLDYVTSGRRIILWDTHRPVGRLPEMRNGDFLDDPIITEYGMSAANVFAVTNNNGLYGVVTRGIPIIDGVATPGPQGWIEQLASDYATSEGGAGDTSAMTRAQIEAKQANLRAQATRNIVGRWTPPVVVRVPDNATLNPALNITINQLIPGVWIPLRAEGGVREVAQWQKLDSMTVEQTDAGEKVSVVMSPAPQDGNDPDADEAVVADA